MKILVINCGSSSLKYQLIDMDGEIVLCKGNCERIGMGGSFITHKANNHRWEEDADFATHAEAFEKVVEMMTKGEGAVVADKKEITAVGHRIVQGAERFTKSEIVTDAVIDTIEEIAHLAPVHNPAHVQGLRSAKKVFGNVPNVVVFDTTFHQTMPPKAYMFAIPYEFYQKHSIRRYGFHGTSHRYVSKKAAEFLNKDLSTLKTVTCHLGSGSSIAAVNGGKSVDTSTGFTPLGGIMMGTRSGDLDPSVVCYMAEITGIHGNKMSELLNKKSGFLGVSGISSDNRDIEEAIVDGNKRAMLAHDMLTYQIKKYIGAYTAAMNGIDCLVFTGGIGENGAKVREDVCKDMEYLGIKLDYDLNKQSGADAYEISAHDSRVKVLVICANEELMIARDTKEIVEQMV